MARPARRARGRATVGLVVGAVAGLAVGTGVVWLFLRPTTAELAAAGRALVPAGFTNVTVSRTSADVVLGRSETVLVRAEQSGAYVAGEVDLVAAAEHAGFSVEESQLLANGARVTAATRASLAFLSVRGDVSDGVAVTAFDADLRRQYPIGVLWPVPVGALLGAIAGASWPPGLASELRAAPSRRRHES
jgi:hypothetical protein